MEQPVSLQWGLIGTTGFADTIFAPALQRAGQRLVGAAGSAPEHSDRFAARHGCPRVYGAVEDLLADPDIDAVWVASPNYLHQQHIAAALTHGKHVLAEKPLATTGADADSLARLAASLDRCFGVGYQARFHPALAELREHVRAGGVGKVAFVRASWQTQYPALPREWRLQRETSGGWSIMDIGTHGLDAALWLTGFPEAQLLAASLSTQHWPVEIDDQALILLKLDSARAIVEAATGVRGPANRVEVYGTEGWAIATGIFVDRLGPAGGSLAASSGIDRSYDAAANPYEAQAAAFAAWTRGHGYAGATASEGARNVEILEAAREWSPP